MTLSSIDKKTLQKWLSDIDYLRNKTNGMKATLIRAISKEVSPSFLETVEGFHQQLMDHDMVMDLIRHEASLLLSLPIHQLSPIHFRQYSCLEKDMEQLRADLEVLAGSLGEGIKVT